MVSAKDLRRMAGKLRALGADQDETTRFALNEMADRYEADADALDDIAANTTNMAKLFKRRH